MIPFRYAPKALMLVNFLKSMLFCIPVLMLYYEYKGVSIGDFFFIQGIAWLFVFVLEIPSGYVGDIFSRKNVVLIGFANWIIGHFIWLSFSGFWGLLAGELFFAIAISFVSGAIEAYLYDLLKKINREKTFHKKLSQFETIGNMGLLFSTLTGAVLYRYIGPNAPIWGSVIALILAVVILCLMPDVPEARRKVATQTSKIKDILSIVHFTARQPQIRWLILYPSIYGILTLILMWGLQSVMIARAVPVVIFSLIFAGNSLGRTIWSALAGRLVEKIGLNKVIYLTLGVIFISTTGACLSVYVPYGAVYLCLSLMIIGSSSCCLANIATAVLIHQQIKSDERSTVISVKSMANRAFAGVGMIALKPLFDTIGVGQTFLVSTLILIPIVLSALHLIKMRITLQK